MVSIRMAIVSRGEWASVSVQPLTSRKTPDSFKCATTRNTGAIHPQTGYAAQRDARVGRDEDRLCGSRRGRHHSAACERALCDGNSLAPDLSPDRHVSGIASQNRARPMPAIAASVMNAAL